MASTKSNEVQTTTESGAAEAVVESAVALADSEGFKGKIYQAISVQRPVVLSYLKSLRREKPDAPVSEILKELEKRYVATVTVSSTGVGASAAIPGVGIPLALGLGVADLLFFYETSALYVLGAAELHGIEVSDVKRAQPLVFATLLGQKSQSTVSKLVLQAAGAGSVEQARSAASGVLPKGWGEVLTQQLPDSALAPLSTVLAREALKSGSKLGAGTLGKTVPFGLGAAIGGIGSFTFGRDVVKAARLAFPETPAEFPESLLNYEASESDKDAAASASTRAVSAFAAAKNSVADFGQSVWDKTTDAASVFRSVDLDGDGIPDEARAVTAAKRAGTGIKSAAVGSAGAVGSLFKRKSKASSEEASEIAEPENGDRTCNVAGRG